MKQRGIFVLGAVVVAVAVGVACSGSDETELGSDAGSNPTSTPTSTSTSTSTTTTTAPTTPPAQDAAPSTDAAPATDSGSDAARPDAGTSMSFFITSTGSGNLGGNLGGLAGADTKCQTLAAAAGAGSRTWRAYLSVAGTNARDRIGTGPWYNQKGVMIAANLNALHTTDIVAANAIDEKGAVVPANQHDILTGTNVDGSANASTCNNWTSNAGNQTGFLGHHDSSTTGNNANDRWNNAHNSQGCSQGALQNSGGAGRIYCFATN